MKKLSLILSTMLCVVMSLVLTSCDTESENAQFGIVYNVTVDGDADGNVNVTFPNGKFEMNGDADLAFVYSNDTIQALQGLNVLTAEEIIAFNDANQLAALNAVNSWVDETFTVSATQAGGTYDVVIKGYVKETLTGLVIAIDKRLTNRENAVVAVANDSTVVAE